MNVLWLANIPLPEASDLMNENPLPLGGWLITASKNLSTKDNIKLSIAFPNPQSKDIKKLTGEKINYFSFPAINFKDKESVRQNKYLKNILLELKPDLVHIFGTEFAHSLAMINICKEQGIKTVINIQGLVSVIAKHYTAGIPIRVQTRFTFRDFVKRSNILLQQKQFEKRGLLEIEAIQKANHIIGRTTWDKACAAQINPNVAYHFCNETLREEFYKHEWVYENCEKYSIFLSQASYPIKGLHHVLEALPSILKKYPQTKVYIAGPDVTVAKTLKDKLKKSSYAKYIEELIERNNLINHISFTGVLQEKQMCERFLKSHIFVSPSIIENESNSLSEAKILGVPSIASYVGGVIDRLKHNEEGFLYQHDAAYMLAHYVCEIFENEIMAKEFSGNARENALQTHNPLNNTKRLFEIYEEILQKKE
ncbi:glycosyltransferase [Sutcliffiella horikoshii]|uniref:glycosyltransferase family 4 protein n=1 Tax=Sutcliffiella horikoshii TaxID=79883 RepID=UPI001CBF3D5C|nr:glycosyltransferase [Sutcliffiella horikoshii]UAL47157.1 glycosyltransferase [Sutcliffiella horikoshii]